MTRVLYLLAATLLVVGFSITGAEAQGEPNPATGESQGSSEQDTTARLYYERGQAAYAAENYDEARQWFRRSYSVSGRPGLLFNIGQAAERAGDEPAAIAAFEQFIELDPDSPKVPQVQRNLAVLRNDRAETSPSPEAVAPSSVELNGAVSGRAQEEVEPAAPLDEEDDGTVFESPWFWVVAVLLVGGGVAAAFLLSSDDEEFPEGTWGNTTTLRWSL